ncbi:MAG TPA: hypothetical protein VGD36_12985 [Xanthobacteraceae bacterium]|jgi:hypothetical protein
MTGVWRRGVSWAGLAAGPAAWAISTQGNYAYALWLCGRRTNLVPYDTAALIVLALLGGLLSWRAWRTSDAAGELIRQANGRPHHLLAALGVFSSLLFASVIAMQGVAGLLLTGCER